jgi:hypothetical protein
LLLANLDLKGKLSLVLSFFCAAHALQSAGLVNGSRGVIVEWIPPAEAGPLESKTGGPSNQKRAGGGFGSEEWREQAANEFIERQGEEFYPVVFFAVGVTSELSLSLSFGGGWGWIAERMICLL